MNWPSVTTWLSASRSIACLQRLAHQRIGQRTLVRQVDADRVVRQRGLPDQLQLGVLAHGAGVAGAEPLHHVELTGLEVDQPHGGVGLRFIDDAVEVDRGAFQ